MQTSFAHAEGDAMESMEGRGSDRLAHLHKHHLSEDHLDRLARLGDVDGVKLIGWEPRGSAGVESVKARFIVRPESLADLIERLMRDRLANHFHGLTNGVLPEPTLVELHVTAGAS